MIDTHGELRTAIPAEPALSEIRRSPIRAKPRGDDKAFARYGRKAMTDAPAVRRQIVQ
jgi:hypothetical protein